MSDKMVLASQDAIQPASMSELKELAQWANKSGFLGTQSPEQALLVMMAGRDLGFSYTQSLRAFHVIKGKPSLSADAAVAVVTSRKDLCEYFRCVEMTPTSVTWETKRVDHPEPARMTFTIEEAQIAGLIDDMYKKWPKRMLSSRCKMFLARDTYPELLMGLLDIDEATAIPDRRVPPAVAQVIDDALKYRNAPSKAWADIDASLDARDRAEAKQAIPDAIEEPEVPAEDEEDDETLVEAMSARIAAASDRQALDSLVKELGVLKAQRRVTDGELAALRGAWAERRDALKEVTT